MPEIISNAASWLFNSIYVIIALAVVYLFFFRFVPTVLNGVKEWTIFAAINVALVLGVMALLLGGVAVNTADWIFSNTLDSLEGTRISGEIQVLTDQFPTGGNSTTNYNSSNDRTYNTTQEQSFAESSPAPVNIVSPSASPGVETTIKLHDDAMSCWLQTVQGKYDETGKLSDNSRVMSESDIPQDMRCEAGALDGSVGNLWNWGFSSSEVWNLSCRHPDFNKPEEFQLNGIAVRGLTGGDFYGIENQKSIFGTGMWPEGCFDVVEVQRSPVSPLQATSPSGGTSEAAPSDGEVVSAGNRTHVVSPGQSLIVIANIYNTTTQALINANKQTYPVLGTNPNLLQPDWELVIP